MQSTDTIADTTSLARDVTASGLPASPLAIEAHGGANGQAAGAECHVGATVRAVERVRERTRKRTARWRGRVLSDLWGGRVVLCRGQGQCAWAGHDGNPGMAGSGCDCRAGEPCKCERLVWQAVEKDAAQRFGAVVGSVVTSAVIDVLRGTLSGNDAEVRTTRATLIDILMRDARGRRTLELQEQRLKARTTPPEPPDPSALLRALAGVSVLQETGGAE